MAPYFSKASIAYSEQVGVNLQLLGSKGDMVNLYSHISDIKTFFISISNKFSSCAALFAVRKSKAVKSEFI